MIKNKRFKLAANASQSKLKLAQSKNKVKREQLNKQAVVEQPQVVKETKTLMLD